MQIETLARLLRRGFGIGCGLLLVAMPANAASPEKPEDSSSGTATIPGPVAPSRGGLIAVVDSEATDSGSLAEADLMLADPELADALSTSSEGLDEVVLPDGSVMVDLQGRFRNVLFATIDAQGAVRTTHSPGTAADLSGPPQLGPQVCRPPSSAGEEVHHATH